jgi:hypothetical protein
MDSVSVALNMTTPAASARACAGFGPDRLTRWTCQGIA